MRGGGGATERGPTWRRATPVRAIALAPALAFTLSLGTRVALGQSAEDRPPGAIEEDVNPKLVPGLVRPAAPSGRSGPMAPVADALAADGFTFHALSLDFFTANPTSGLSPGHVENSLYNILGVDLDLSRRTDLSGASLHYETTIFGLEANDRNFLAQVGDSKLGYQGTYNIRTAVISVATFEQKALDDRLDFEIGRTHPNRYYALPMCQSLDSCFQNVLYFDAGFTSPQYSVWGANLSYKLTPSLYAEAGVFSTNDGARIGYDLGAERNTGVLAIAELGSKTDFDTQAYPARYAVTGFVNTSSHADDNAATPTRAGGPLMRSGTSGLVVQAQKSVWRADGGREQSASPTAIALYGSGGAALDSTTPIGSDVYVGATLQAPFEGRPADRFGVKIDWQRLNPSFASYLAAANLVSGGSGAPFSGNEFVFELNAHLQLPGGLAFEPVLQYAVHPDSFYNPFSAARPRDGLFAIGTLIVPVGVLLGLAPG